MKKHLKTKTTYILIVFICLITAILQSVNFTGFSCGTQNAVCIAVFAVYAICVVWSVRAKTIKDNISDFIIVGAVLLRAWYVINTGINDRQHDEGYITTLTDNLVNDGHLGYIEYFVKNHHMPDFNPFDVVSYYHPPLHHIISAVMVMINLAFNVDYAYAFENVQVMTLLYSAITMIFTRKILDYMTESDGNDNKPVLYYVALALICFHPSLTYLSASVNNDMLTIMLETIVIYYTLIFIREKNLKNLMLIAVSLGFAVISKMNAAIFALPVGIVFLMLFVNEVKQGNGKVWIKRFVLFGVVCGFIGLSFTLRNAIVFHEKPGILSANSDSFQYMGNYSLFTRLGIPKTLDLDYPFHSEYAKASSNVWLIMLKTSVFSEVRPDVNGFGLFLSRIVLLLTLLLCVLLTILIVSSSIKMIKNDNKIVGTFSLVGFLTIVLTFIAFVIKYPYTCSCDFRYITISLIFGAIAIVSGSRFSKIVGDITVAFLIVSNIFLYYFCI